MTDSTPSDPRPPESILEIIGRKTGEVPDVSLSEAGSEADATRVSLDPQMDVAFAPQSRGNYQVLGEVARGGMGAVLRGHDADLRRDVAIKVLDERLAGRPEVVQRFVEEAQIGAQLQHPGVVPVYELGLMADERPFFTMKLIKGRTLASLLGARASADADLRRFLAIFEQICQTIAYAHSKGVLHRDLKPANVMVGAFGEVQVVDWGLAKVLGRGGVADERRAMRDQHTVIDTVRSGPGSSGSESVVGSVLGTPAYMPPEQARGEVEELDERADVFALGALLCELLTGKPPYLDDGEDPPVLQAARAHLQPARARLAESGADEELVRLALDCMAPAPQARPASAEDLARTIQAYLASAEERARQAHLEASEARIKAGEERKRRRLAVALGATVVTLLVALGGGYVWIEGQREAQRAGVRRQLDELQATALELQGAERHHDALAKAREALALAEAEDLGDELTGRVASFVATVETAASEERARRALEERNRALFDRLETTRLQRSLVGVSTTAEEVDATFRDAFLEYGLDLEDEDLVATLTALRERGMGEELALWLDEWAGIKRVMHGWEAAEPGAITALAADLDPDPLRTEIRAALLVRDTDALIGMLHRLDVETVPAGTTWVMASAVNDVGQDPSELLERAVIEHPGDVRFRLLLGAFFERRQRFELALRELEIAHALRPDNAHAIAQRAQLSYTVGDLPTAVRLFRELEVHVPGLTRGRGDLGLSLFLLGRYEEVIELFERPRSEYETDGSDLVHLASARYGVNELSADELVRTVEEIRWDSYSLLVVAWALAEHTDPGRRDLERALAFAAESVRLDPGSWLGRYIDAAVNLRAANHEATLAALDPIQPFHELRGDVAFSCAALRALAHHHLGEPDAAREWLAQARFLFRSVGQAEHEAWFASPAYAHLKAAEELIE